MALQNRSVIAQLFYLAAAFAALLMLAAALVGWSF